MKRISDETVKRLQPIIKGSKGFAKFRKKITLYQKNDTGYAMARTIATNDLSDLVHEIGIMLDQRKRLTNHQLDTLLAKKKYRGVTDPFLSWLHGAVYSLRDSIREEW